MLLNSQEMINAIYDNDKSYDGMFYYGINTTKVYCKPSCRAKIPREKNIVLFRSRQEAENKGYTPCAKCKPDEQWNQCVYDTDLGKIKITEKSNCITEISFCDVANTEFMKPSELTDLVAKQIVEYIGGKRKTFDFPMYFTGSDFQKAVWTELAKVPYGETTTYLDIAQRIGSPRASRAVGKANNKNPLLIVIPCHRVVGANYSLTGYAAGLEVKQKLLAIEQQYK